MPYKVLVVDDSSFYRRRLTTLLEQDPSLTVVAEAKNGIEAVSKAIQFTPDVITMDVEMPVMNGISAVAQIMKKVPTPILMFSSLTKEGAKETLDALDAGALDYVSKQFDDITSSDSTTIKKLLTKVRRLASSANVKARSVSRLRSRVNSSLASTSTSTLRSSSQLGAIASKKKSVVYALPRATKVNYELLVIGASTGGPVAIQKVLNALPRNFKYPIIVLQHMPGSFTSSFAERLNSTAKVKVVLAADGQKLKAGVAYVAVGDMQMRLVGTSHNCSIIIEKAPSSARLLYAPTIDYTMDSIANVFAGNVLSVILTGMGSDGTKGSRILHKKGAVVWSQDEASSVVYGMPSAVALAGVVERQFAIGDIGQKIVEEMM